MKDIEEKEKSEKKSSELLVTILVVLLMVACVGGGYLLGATNVLKINNDNNKSNDTTEKEDTEVKDDRDIQEDSEIVNLDRSEVETIFNNLDRIGFTPEDGCEGYTEYYTDHKVTVNDISNDLVSHVVLQQLKNKFEFKENNTFTKAQVKDIITKTFGKNYSYIYESIDYCPDFTYDPSTELYTIVGVKDCIGICSPDILKKMDSYEAEDNKLEIMVRVLFYSKNIAEEFKFYSDYNRTMVADIDTTNLKNDDNFLKGGLYKLVFTKEDGNYVFVSSEPVNQ